ncbi:signal peptidase I [Convivina intestini]|uniref:Signal peptidase I n=1 Tax=Convivina intestini TaxID=1505726 RepID=A0A2U1DEP0_9LACO|nr:signal peptidase I [Convivina intestini]PVY86124.1 signal peptidase I [Convivina intestini]CAH1851447.1 Signal peptidase IB [Convivina intestini]CAH1853028.1 Signal peptidase IB [Convivina intestini]SDB80916.1 signal peptidase I [Leuconostocaceae bacterium R-53105]
MEKVKKIWPNIVKFTKQYLLLILAALLVGWLIHRFVFTASLVQGNAMAPTLKNHQYIFINRLTKIKRGDVVNFTAHGIDARQGKANNYVQRVIGLPGDTVSYHQGALYVNQKLVSQNYLSNQEKGSGTELIFGDPWDLKTLSESSLWKNADRHQERVPAGKYFVLGDKRSQSNDSRYFGFVPAKDIHGKVVGAF